MTFFLAVHGEDAVAVLPLGPGVLRINCSPREVTYQKDARASEEYERVKREAIFTTASLSGGELVVQLRFMGKETGWADPKQIEVFVPKEGKHRTLVENVSLAGIFPTSNGKFVAVEYISDQSLRRILVIDEKGVPIATIDAK